MLNKRNFFLDLMDEKIDFGRRSFTFVIETEEQFDTTLKAMYKSGCIWYDDVASNKEVESDIRYLLNEKSVIKIRISYSERYSCMNMLCTTRAKEKKGVKYDLELNEVIKLLAYIKKGFKEIDRRREDNIFD